MGREFVWQLKLPVAVSGVKFWNVYKSKNQWKFVLYARRKYSFWHNEVYKGTKSVLTIIDGIVLYILGANWRYIFLIWKCSFFHTADIDNILILLSQTHDSRYQVFYLSLLFQRCWEIVLVGFCHNVPESQAHKNFNNGILFPWILWNNLQAVIAVPFIDQTRQQANCFHQMCKLFPLHV